MVHQAGFQLEVLSSTSTNSSKALQLGGWQLAMKADSASHLLSQQISFELFLFSYLTCALLLQKINIYKTNFHLIDFNLVLFTIVILSRRLGWSLLQELQSYWPPTKQQTKGSSKGSGSKWSRIFDAHLKHVMVVLCTLLVIAWSVVRLIQQTSLFNLLFLFYPLLLYLSLFGFTLEPRMYRSRFVPPRTFLQHIDFNTNERQLLRSKIFSQHLVQNTNVATLTPSSGGHSHAENSPTPQNTCHLTSNHNNKSSNSLQAHSLNSMHGSTSQKTNNRNNLNKDKQEKSNSPTEPLQSQSSLAKLALGNMSGDRRYTWEYALMLPTTPDEVRKEVEILLSDLIVRLKQLLFNSLLCAYYVGFIPMLFADSHLFYDKWWCVEHAFLVWANSFVILSSLLLPPSYCQLLYQCALHLGCWTRCTHDNNTSTWVRWSPSVIWQYEAVVQWNGESFKGEGVYNMAIPCDSSQEFFYLLFQSRLHVHTWLLTMQCITVLFQVVVLLRSIYWFQLLSMSVLLVFNSFVFYKLLYNRIWWRKKLWVAT